jgi:predicted RNA-binding protein (virulence factor B family)
VLEIGQISKFTVEQDTGSGFYIKEIESEKEVYMPSFMAPVDVKVNDELEAFVYLDNKGHMIASADLPPACVGEYALLEVAEVQEFGAFFDWGLDKDLLVPGNEQKVKVQLGESHIVRICLEEGADRVYGTTKLGRYIEDSDSDLLMNDKVKMVAAQKTELGYRMIINKTHIGMIYHNEIFGAVVIGEEYDGVVKSVRFDGLVDAALQIQGIKNLDAATFKIMDMLKKYNGKCYLNDKSSPDEIKSELGMSKKTFKSAIGMLYRMKKIVIAKDGISIVKKK